MTGLRYIKLGCGREHWRPIFPLKHSSYLSEYESWEPIGDDDSPFTGNYDGRDFSISNMTIDRPDENHIGLFGVIDRNDGYNVSDICNMNIVNVSITGGQYVGALAGKSYARVNSCHSSGAISCIQGRCGGLIGFQYEAGETFANHMSDIIGFSSSVAIADISGEEQRACNDLGGLLGITANYYIDQCFATGNIAGRIDENDGSNVIGGLIGEIIRGEGIISNCYAIGSVGGYECIGGFVGVISMYDSRIFSNCYSTGAVTATDYYGGFCGFYLGPPLKFRR